MKARKRKSTAIVLVLSGALLSGCGRKQEDLSQGWDAGPVTNNTYRPGLGYYHAPYYHWYPHPYNWYSPGFGYYHGGMFSPQPFQSSNAASRPQLTGSGRSGSSTTSSSRSSVSRGGFGGSGSSSGT